MGPETKGVSPWLDSPGLTADEDGVTLPDRIPMATPTTTSAVRPTLWVTLIALLLVALTSQVRVRTCVGECAEPVEQTCCVAEPADAGDACCGCCEDGEEAPTPSGGDGEGAGGCDGGCCITIAFDVDMAPSVDVAKLPTMLPAICWIAPLPQPAVRVLQSARPFYFDRGPPRIDGRTALRATQVLLI